MAASYMFSAGMASYLFSPVALSATLAMVASYFFAITLVPAFCARILKKERADAGGTFVDRLSARYLKVIDRLLGARRGVLLGTLLLFALAGFLCFITA